MICVGFTLIVLMQNLRITDVSTGDARFVGVALGFHVVP